MIHVRGEYDLTFPWAENPPDTDSVVALVESLGHSLAVGRLAEAAGINSGPALVESVDRFVADYLPDENPPWGAIGKAVSTGGKMVGKAADAVIGRLKANPRLVSTLGTLAVVGALGAGWLSIEGQSRKAEIDAHTRATEATLARLTPEEAAKVLLRLDGQRSGGGGLTTFLWVGAAVAAGLVLWRLAK